MFFFVLAVLFAFVYNVLYCVHLIKRRQVSGTIGAVFALILLISAIGLAYNAI